MTVGNEEFLRGLYNLRYLFGDKWAPAIIVALANGKMRRAKILSTVNSYSIGSDKHAVLHDSILARTLKKMTREGILVRTRRAEIFPPRVYYSLNPEIVEFLRVVEPVVEWVRRHPDLIAQAQEYSRYRGDDMENVTGIDELDEVGIGPHKDTDHGDLMGRSSA